jgi:hypothetical protein
MGYNEAKSGHTHQTKSPSTLRLTGFQDKFDKQSAEREGLATPIP